jgi:hypothetical protein
VIISCVVILLLCALAAPIPPQARILDRAHVAPHRALVLWMENAKEIDDEADWCGTMYTTLHHVRGRAFVSLIDDARHVINTIRVDDALDVPKKHPIRLRDYNGDGRAQELILFSLHDTCSDTEATLIGYSAKRDRAIQYETRLRVDDDGKHRVETVTWLPAAVVGRWHFTMRYPEEHPRGFRYDIEYGRASERFYGTEVIK